MATRQKAAPGAYSMAKPCPNCPFRSDVRAYLTRGRVREIERSLERSEFACHKTTADDDGTGERVATSASVHCAGAMILMLKEGRSSQMMRIAHRLGMFDPDRLDMDAPVFESFDDMADAQPSGRGGEEDEDG